MGGLSSIDVALEEAEVLTKLDPEEPLGSDEDMVKDCNEVGKSPRKEEPNINWTFLTERQRYARSAKGFSPKFLCLHNWHR